jgi:hypothetical protein
MSISKLTKLYDRESTILHVLPASEKEQGIQAVIILKTDRKIKPPAHLGLPDVLQANTVYLQTSHRAQAFKKFYDAENAVAMPFATYLETLQFFQDEWPSLETKLRLEIRHMRAGDVAMTIQPYIAFFGHGSIVFEKLYSDALLYIRADSKDSSDRIQITLQYNKRNIHIESNVIVPMLQGLDYLKKLQYKDDAKEDLKQ